MIYIINTKMFINELESGKETWTYFVILGYCNIDITAITILVICAVIASNRS